MGLISQVEVVSNAPRLLATYEKSGYVEVWRQRLEEYIPEDSLTQKERGLQVVVMHKRKRENQNK